MSRQIFFCLQCRFYHVNVLADEFSRSLVQKNKPQAITTSATVCLKPCSCCKRSTQPVKLPLFGSLSKVHLQKKKNHRSMYAAKAKTRHFPKQSGLSQQSLIDVRCNLRQAPQLLSKYSMHTQCVNQGCHDLKHTWFHTKKQGPEQNIRKIQQLVSSDAIF